jgi:AraC-like DNA-binding protein
LIDCPVHARIQLVDALTEVLDSLRLHGGVYCRSQLDTPWRLHFAQHTVAVFHVVEHGSGWLLLENAHEPIQLKMGDLVLLPHGTAHTVGDTLKSKLRAPSIVMDDTHTCRNEKWCPNEADAILLCGTFQLEGGEHHPLWSLLPAMIHVTGNHDWISTLTHLMRTEVNQTRPGLETVIRRLSDVLLVQTLRHWLETDADQTQGWLGALRDRRIARALARMHAQPSLPWTVETLAEASGLSRSAFAARFTTLVGEPPLSYLVRWRIYLARRMLLQTRHSLLEIAERSGYSSEVAFHRAFKRVTGTTPGAYRRSRRANGAQSEKPSEHQPW